MVITFYHTVKQDAKFSLILARLKSAFALQLHKSLKQHKLDERDILIEKTHIDAIKRYFIQKANNLLNQLDFVETKKTEFKQLILNEAETLPNLLANAK